MSTNINYNGTRIGIVTDNTFYAVRKPEHFFIKFQSFGLSKPVISQLADLDVDTIKFKYLGQTEIEYTCSLLDFANSEKEFTDTSTDFEDAQKHVSLSDMHSNLPNIKQEKL